MKRYKLSYDTMYKLAWDIQGMSWLVYPPGVFLSGNFQRLGRLETHDGGGASASTGCSFELFDAYGSGQRHLAESPRPGNETDHGAQLEGADTHIPTDKGSCEYRPLIEYPDLKDAFVVATSTPGGGSGRYFFRFASTMQGGLMWDPQREEVVYVLVRASMIRTIGEKLLTALH